MEAAVDALDYDFVLFDNQDLHESAAENLIWSENIEQSLTFGSSIVLKGKVLPVCKRFSVNLLSLKNNHRSDVVFHFNPRLAQRYVVRNSMLNGSWGEEETTSVGIFELHRNKSFELSIICTEREFFVSLNGRHFCAYSYRSALCDVNKIQVEGPVHIDGIERTPVSFYPKSSPQNVPFTVPMGEGDQDRVANQQLVLPFVAALPEGLPIGSQVEIFGQVKILPSSFYINLQEGQYLWPHPIIPLHLNPRFYTSYGSHLFIRNSWSNGEWGAEERSPGGQFTPGSYFHLVIRKLEDQFSVLVDGKLAGEFRFRVPADKIDTVFIHGDVNVNRVFLSKF